MTRHDVQMELRSILQAKLRERCKQNPSYSLRSFAKSLDVDPGTLSQLMRGKRFANAKMIKKLSSALKLSSVDVAVWLNGLQTADENKDYRENNEKRKRCERLSKNAFEATAHWYYDAILELTNLPGFRLDPVWIGECLKLSPSLIENALARLNSLKLLVEADGKWIDASEFNEVLVEKDQASLAATQLQSEILTKSRQALTRMTPAHRYHGSLTMAVAREDLARIKTKIRIFTDDLMNFCNRQGANPDQVGILQVAFFPVSYLNETKITSEKNQMPGASNESMA